MKTFHNIEKINPYELIPYKNNHQIHEQQQIEKLAYWVKTIGFPESMAILYEIDENNGDRIILHGHRRRLAAIHLNLESIPAQRVEGLTEEEAIAWRMADNSLTLQNQWDWDATAKEIERLKELQSDAIVKLGFAEKHLQKLKPVIAVPDKWGSSDRQDDQLELGKDESDSDFDEKDAIGPTRMVVATLTSAEFKLWCEFKAKIGEKDDTKALMEAIKE